MNESQNSIIIAIDPIYLSLLLDGGWKRVLPMPKFFGLFSNNGLTFFLDSATLDLRGAAATLLLPFLTVLVGFLTAVFNGYRQKTKTT